MSPFYDTCSQHFVVSPLSSPPETGTIKRLNTCLKSKVRGSVRFKQAGGGSKNYMPHADLYIATEHCQAMRDLIVHHTGGWADPEALNKFQQMTAAAASAVDDLECKHLASAIVELAGDLFSAIGHAKWAQGQTSGADVLRLRILREITAFQGRLTYIEAVGTGAEQDGHRRDTHSPKAR